MLLEEFNSSLDEVDNVSAYFTIMHYCLEAAFVSKISGYMC